MCSAESKDDKPYLLCKQHNLQGKSPLIKCNIWFQFQGAEILLLHSLKTT